MELFKIELISLLTGVLFAINIVVSVHILLKKSSEPTSAMLWLFVIFSMPVAGICLYLLFGINRLKTVGLKVKLANQLIKAEIAEPVHTGIINYQYNQAQFAAELPADSTNLFNQTLDKLFPKKGPLSGNCVKLLHDGTTVYPAMLNAIENATNSIHLQSYIIMNDSVGKRILDALERKADEGLDVKVLYDRFGSYKAILAMFFKKYAKLQTRLQMSAFAHSTLFSPWRIQLRNHRKLMVVDGKTAFIGGMNIDQENEAKKAKIRRSTKYIHDIHCIVTGPVVGELQFSFLRDWYYATDADPVTIFTAESFPKLEKCGGVTMRVIDSGPGQSNEASFNNFMAAINTARKQLLIMTPYFIPNNSFVDMLCFAAVRGVDVKLIVPAVTDHWYVGYASQSYYKRLLRRGVRIFEKDGPFMHSKAMLIDGETGIMGSSNCDNRSFRLNYELDFVATGMDFTTQLERHFDIELKDTSEITLEQISQKNILVTLLENTCSLLSPIL